MPLLSSPPTRVVFFPTAQARLGAHRAMLCHCLSLLSSSLSKQQLKSGLSVEEVAAVARTAYLAGPEARLGEPRPTIRDTTSGRLCRAPPSSVYPSLCCVDVASCVSCARTSSREA